MPLALAYAQPKNFAIRRVGMKAAWTDKCALTSARNGQTLHNKSAIKKPKLATALISELNR